MRKAELRQFLEENVRNGKSNAVILAYLKKNYGIEIKYVLIKFFFGAF